MTHSTVILIQCGWKASETERERERQREREMSPPAFEVFLLLLLLLDDQEIKNAHIF